MSDKFIADHTIHIKKYSMFDDYLINSFVMSVLPLSHSLSRDVFMYFDLWSVKQLDKLRCFTKILFFSHGVFNGFVFEF